MISKLDSLRPHALDLLRIYLGIGLLVRGAHFTNRQDVLLELIQSSGDWFWPFALAHLVVMVHIGGGLLLAVGLLTRVSALVQLPAVIGAVLFVHAREGLFTTGQSLELSVLVMFMLGLFAIVGSGKWSVDSVLGQGFRGLKNGPISRRFRTTSA